MKNFDKTYKQNWQHCAKQGTTTHLTEEKKRENKYLGIEKSNFVWNVSFIRQKAQ